jgi:NADPH-dependent curcumin reductase CurA
VEEIKNIKANDQDPTMRNWLNAARSYMRPIDIGEPMRAAGIGRVVGSKSEKFAPGDLVRLCCTVEGQRLS